jgi:hypothetical protein
MLLPQTRRGRAFIDGRRVEVPAAVSRILVLPVPRPTILLAGSRNLSRGYEDFKRGVRIFSDIRLSVSRPEGEEGAEPGVAATPTETKVDKCAVREEGSYVKEVFFQLCFSCLFTALRGLFLC